MAGPVNPFEAQWAAALQNGAPLPAQGATVPLGGGPSLGWMAPARGLLDIPQQMPAPAPAPPPVAPAPPPGPAVDYPPAITGELGIAPGVGAGPAGPDPLAAQRGVSTVDPIKAPAAPAQGQRPPMPPDVQFAPTVAGVRPAREMDIRGPRQTEHLMASFEDPLAATDRVDLRSAMAAQREADEYGIQADKALHREEAADRALMMRQAQLERVQMDFEDEVSKLGQFKIDDKRYWKKQDAGDLIGASLLMFFGGLGQASGAGNIGFQYIMDQIDKDVDAQKFDYQVQLDKAKGAQNAFAQALDRFQSEDAATAAARAAGIDAALNKIGVVQANWKGVDAANKADMLRAQLLSERQQTIAAGIKFVPAQNGRMYRMVVRGQEVPGYVTEKEAQRIALEHGVKPAERVDEKMVEGGMQLAGKQMELAGKRMEKADEGAKFIADKLQTAGVPQARQSMETALALLNESPGGALEAGYRGAVPKVIAEKTLDDKANAREQAFQLARADLIHALTGAGMGEKERENYYDMMGAASTPEARVRTLKMGLQKLEAIEKNARAGVSPVSQAKFSEQRQDAEGGPPVAPKGSTSGWGR